jgi:hypothetical protein
VAVVAATVAAVGAAANIVHLIFLNKYRGIDDFC